MLSTLLAHRHVSRASWFHRVQELAQSIRLLAAIAGTLVTYSLIFSCVQVGCTHRGDPSLPTCARRLKTIGLAMHNYHEAYGVFPPRVVYGKDGIPMHSWRVLLLPYVEECKDYYAAYDFSRPWNSWTNRRLLEKVPDCYVCPEDSERRAGETSYVAVYGDHSVWDRPEEAAAAVLAHDPEAITGIAVVETRQRGFLWTEPKDIRIDQFVRQCGVTGAQTGRTSSRLGTNVVCLNCLVYGLPKTTQPAAIRAMISVVGGMSMKNARQYLKEPFRE